MDEYDIVKAFEAIEQELIQSMMRNMARHRAEEVAEGFQWSMWQAEQLKSLEKYKRENQKKYSKPFQDINNSIDQLILQSRQMGQMNQEISILQAIKKGFFAKKVSTGFAAEFFKLNERKLEALIKATNSDMVKAETAMLRMANDQYRKMIFHAQVYANTGAGTYDKAVDMATKDFLSRGINCIEYKNGTRVDIASYAAMAIQTANKRAYLTGEGEKRQEWGIHTVILNKRGAACPKCILFSGKVFIDDVWSGGKATDGNFPLLSTAIAKGLYHPRCRDSHTTYFEGITSPPKPMTNAEIQTAKENYKLQQEQKYNERMVRKYKRLQEGTLEEQTKEEYVRKVQEWKAKNRTLIQSHFDLLRENSNAYKTRGIPSLLKNRQIQNPEFLPVRNWESATISSLSRIEDELSLLPERHQSILRDSNIEIQICNDRASQYNPTEQIIYLNENFEPFELVHETAHALEQIDGVWEDPKFRNMVEEIAEKHPVASIKDDPVTFSKAIRFIEDERFVSQYQGRVYDKFGETRNGNVNPDALWDYLAEGYRCYIEEPGLLKSKDKALFNYIEEWIS